MKDDPFSRFVQACPDGVLLTRLNDGLILDANQAFLRMGGWAREEVVGKTTVDIGIWLRSAGRASFLDELERTGTGTAQFPLHSSAGHEIQVEASARLIEIEGHRCVIGFCRDVTERERAAEELQRTYDMLRATIESTADGILVVDDQGRTVHANTRFMESWGMPSEVAGGTAEERLSFILDQLEDPDAFRSRVSDIYETDEESFDTLTFKDGRTFERYSRPLHGESGVSGRVWSFREVTERKQTEEAVRAAERKYRTLIEQIPAVTYIDAVEGPVTTLYISPQTESILGYSQEDWFNDPHLLSTSIHPDDHDRWRQEVDSCERSGEPFRLEYRILGRDGRVVWVHDESVLLRDEAGQPLFWQGVMFDITERKQAEEKLEHAWQREMEAAQRLRALDEMKNTFLQAVSHELRTPLTIILGSALTLEREGIELTDEERADLVRRMAANSLKLNRLLTDLLDLDRLARGIVEPKRQLTDLAALVRRVVEDVEQAHRVRLDLEPVEAWVDPAKVERIVENLVANALRHTPPTADVVARVRSQPGGVLLIVDDSGRGIPESEHQAIFEPFRQLPADQHSPGVGIGLSLVARFAEIHGGRAWVEDRPEGGASFRVYLPEQGQEFSPTFEAPAATETART